MLKAFPDFFPFNLQTLGLVSLSPNMYTHLPTRIRPTPLRSARILSVFPPLREYPNVGHSHTHHENWQEQFSTTAGCRIECRTLDPQKAKTADQLGRVGRIAQSVLRQEKSHFKSRVFGHVHCHGDARGEL